MTTEVVAPERAPEPSEEQINAAGFEGEKGYHGTPAGIDNTAATFGGVLRFQRTDGAPLFEMKKLATPIRIVYASTGITASTSKVVGDVGDAASWERLAAEHGTAFTHVVAGAAITPTP